MFKVDDFEYSLLIKKLEDEGYLFEVSGESTRITLKGLDWISPEMGGFTQERQNAIDRRVYADSFDKRAERNGYQLTVGTWFLVGVTAAIVLVSF